MTTSGESAQKPQLDPRAADPIALAVCIGIGLGLAEVGFQLFQRHARHLFLFQSRDFLWMTPVADLVLLAIPALVLTGLSARWPRRFTWRHATIVYLFLGISSILLLVGRLDDRVVPLLAAGVAVQGTRWLARVEEGFVRFCRAAAPVLAGGLLILAAACVGIRHARDSRQSVGGVAAPGRPNVLLIILDTVRAANLSLYGYSRPTTPEITRWAERGVRFERAFAAAPWTLPSHASILTGRNTPELATNWHSPLGPEPATLAEVLRRQGYRTAGFVANMAYCSTETGLARGFGTYEDYPVTPRQTILSTGWGQWLAGSPRVRAALGLPQLYYRRPASEINAHFLRWADARLDQPFFAFLNFFDAHHPYEPPPGFRGFFRSDTIPPPSRSAPGKRPWQPEERALDQALYDESLRYLDAEIGALLETLDHRGLLQNTIVILTSDHGEEFGEHGVIGHGHTLYRPALQVPLMALWPGHIPAAAVVEQPVALRNIPATILDLVGLDTVRVIPGTSLAAYWSEHNPAQVDTIISEVRKVRNQPAWYPASAGDLFSVTLGRFRYIRHQRGGKEELYAMDGDSWEQNNLADSGSARATLEAYQGIVDAIQRKSPERSGMRR